jgi:CBS-domain-containing membrane protein
MAISLAALRRLAGIGPDPAGHLEKGVATLGGLVAILAVLLISRTQAGPAGSLGVVSSMGSSAVLLFALPHGPLSQPWAVIGGHLLSALVGVACLRFVPDPMLAAAVAVGLATGVMYYLRCLHPPGGATALAIVIGGEPVRQLGLGFVLDPVLLNAATILSIAVIFNYPFPWRRYPAALAQRPATEAGHE